MNKYDEIWWNMIDRMLKKHFASSPNTRHYERRYVIRVVPQIEFHNPFAFNCLTLSDICRRCFQICKALEEKKRVVFGDHAGIESSLSCRWFEFRKDMLRSYIRIRIHLAPSGDTHWHTSRSLLPTTYLSVWISQTECKGIGTSKPLLSLMPVCCVTNGWLWNIVEHIIYHHFKLPFVTPGINAFCCFLDWNLQANFGSFKRTAKPQESLRLFWKSRETITVSSRCPWNLKGMQMIMHDYAVLNLPWVLVHKVEFGRANHTTACLPVVFRRLEPPGAASRICFSSLEDIWSRLTANASCL